MAQTQRLQSWDILAEHQLWADGMADVHQGSGWTAADLSKKTQPHTHPAGLEQQCAWLSMVFLADVTSEGWKRPQLSSNLPRAAYDGAELWH